MNKKIINLTDKTVIVYSPYGNATIEPAGIELKETTMIKTAVNGIQLVERITNLPDEEQGTYYIVPEDFKPNNNTRRDLLIPHEALIYGRIQVCRYLLLV